MSGLGLVYSVTLDGKKDIQSVKPACSISIGLVYSVTLDGKKDIQSVKPACSISIQCLKFLFYLLSLEENKGAVIKFLNIVLGNGTFIFCE